MTLRTAMRFGDFSKNISKPLDRMANRIVLSSYSSFYGVQFSYDQPIHADVLYFAELLSAELSLFSCCRP